VKPLVPPTERRDDAAAIPAMTLRGGAAVDGYDTPPAHDPEADEPTDAYLETYAYWGLAYLDPASWRHYLPGLIDYALRHLGEPGSMVTEGLLGSLRPPDREPPRLGSLSGEQEAVVMAVLDQLAFDDAPRVVSSPCRCSRSTGSRTRSTGPPPAAGV
jgi:hypothetical protein